MPYNPSEFAKREPKSQPKPLFGSGSDLYNHLDAEYETKHRLPPPGIKVSFVDRDDNWHQGKTLLLLDTSTLVNGTFKRDVVFSAFDLAAGRPALWMSSQVARWRQVK